MKTNETVLEALQDLQQQGYTYDFNLRQGCVYCQQEELTFLPHEFEIQAVHRFENMSDPAENAVVYVIRSVVHGIRGTLVDAFGLYAEARSSDLLARMNSSYRAGIAPRIYSSRVAKYLRPSLQIEK